MLPFQTRLARAVEKTGPAMVGLDPHLDRLPRELVEPGLALSGRARRERLAEGVLRWSEAMLEAIAGHVGVVKPQVAFYEQLGAPGWAALEGTCVAARRHGLMVLLDAKRGDIGSTAEAYAHALLDDDGPIGADAVTLSPWLGPESLSPFLERCRGAGKGIFVLVRTSNPGAEALQLAGGGAPVATLAERMRSWNRELQDEDGWGPVGAVVGGTLGAARVGHWRRELPASWLLVPGFGAQGAGVADVKTVRGGTGALINSSRSITFGTDDVERSLEDCASATRDRAASFAQSLQAGSDPRS